MGPLRRRSLPVAAMAVASACLAVAVAGVATADDTSSSAHPATPSDCKKGGWKAFSDPSFRNQGECVAYVAGLTAGKHDDGSTGTAAPAAPEATAAPTTPEASVTPVTPVLLRAAVGEVRSGAVTIQAPGAPAATPFTGGRVPFGATLDATKGRVRLISALPGGGKQAATVWGGAVKVTQTRADGTVSLKLPPSTDRSPCALNAHRGLAIAASRKRRLQSLWVKDHHGHYTTHGRNSNATVRGTVWVTRERCDGTFTYVRRGRVVVKDRHTGRRVTLHAGSGYLARDVAR
jgi:hypothetical protein